MRFDHARHTRWAVISVRMSIWCMIDVTDLGEREGSSRGCLFDVRLHCGCEKRFVYYPRRERE